MNQFEECKNPGFEEAGLGNLGSIKRKFKKGIVKIAKNYSLTPTYVEALFEACKKYDIIKEFKGLLNNGYTDNIQIQYADDNYTGEKWKHENIEFLKNDRNSSILGYFIYKNKYHYFVIQ